MRRAYLENPRGEFEVGRPLLAPRFDTFATIITMPSLRMVTTMRVTRLANIRIFSLRPEREFLLAQLVFLLNMRVYHFMA